jgi:hypothetical protein
MLDSSDVLVVLDQPDQAGLVVWLDGGWGLTRCSAATAGPWGARSRVPLRAAEVWSQAMCAMGAAVRLEVLVVWSFVDLALRRVLGLMVLCWRSARRGR